MIRSDFHIHTNFTDGADSAEEMVIAAIEAGIETLGFSEHAYVPFDPDFCLSPETSVLYRNEISRLKSKYDEKIELLCGIEMDIDSPDDPDKYDYVIGSVHYLSAGGKVYSIDLSPQETAACVSEGFGGSYESYAEAYFEKVSRLKEVTHADIIGHFDLISKFEASKAAPDISCGRCKRAWKSAVSELSGKAVFEINTGGISRGYKKEAYPSPDILDELYRLNGKIVLSSDSHGKKHLLYGFEQAELSVRKHGFTCAGFTDRFGKYHKQF